MAKDKNERICIIGAGPAGLSAGMYLEKAGYSNYTILERSNRVGGKCYSPTYKGRRYETGAMMGCDSYFAVDEIQQFTGDVGKGIEGFNLKSAFKNSEGKTIDPFNPKNPFNLPRLLKTKQQVKRFGKLLSTKYEGYDLCGHGGVMQGKYEGFRIDNTSTWIKGENENLKDLALPFDEFCKKNKIEHVKDIWVCPFTAFGYGYFDEMATGYVIKYLDFYTGLKFVSKDFWNWTDGTQSIYEHLNDKLKHPARLNCGITNVSRRDGKVFVTVNGQIEEYDDIIITAPLQYMPEYFDATPREISLFGKIDYERYDTMNVTIKKGHYPDVSYYLYPNLQPKKLGRMMVFYNRWMDDEDQVLTTYVLRKHKDMESEIPYEEARKNVLEDLEKCGCPVDQIIDEHTWYYFPHVSCEDYAAGWYDEVEAMQGTNNTYYAGEIMSFGDMEETVEYSKALVHRFFE